MAPSWPFQRAYAARYRVPDLLPGTKRVRAVFVGESPHRDEVAPESAGERSPFRGMAGREWWSALAKFQRHPLVAKPVPPRAELEALCRELGVAVLNAVQFPLDPKISLHTGESAVPARELGFAKDKGATGYKAVLKTGGKQNPVEQAIRDLQARLLPWVEAGVPVVCLGNDSRWFVERAVGAEGAAKLLTIPHPSSWWRNGENRRRALSTLDQLLG